MKLYLIYINKYYGMIECWNLNKKYHRNDGPAAIWDDGTQEWFQYDQLHREDGPAVIWHNGDKQWYKNHKQILK